MKLYRRVILTALVIICFQFPSWLYALGEFDGFWVGTQDIYADGEHERVTSPTVIYQPSVGEIYFWDEYFGAVRLVKSGNRWVLPAPLEAEFWNIEVVITSVSFTFPNSSSLNGTIQAEAKYYDVTARSTIKATKKTCAALSNGQTLTNLSGAADSFKCYQIELPVNARDLQVETWGGYGDCDLGVIYSRPDFDFLFSEGYDNDEMVSVAYPESGKWYFGLYGFENYGGVSLQVSFREVAEVIARFGVDTWYGAAPLQVNFSDQSNGDVNSWEWHFGDGATAYSQNPSHTYTSQGIYTVQLTVSGPDGSDTEIFNDLIRVYSPAAISDIEAFVTRFYNLCLSRAPDPGGLFYWVSSLLDGTRAGADIALGFIFSQEFLNLDTTNEQYLDVLYHAFFNRASDPGGFSKWLADLIAGVSREEVLDGFIYSQEFVNLCNAYGINPFPDPVEEFVKRFYQLCLGREADADGLRYWVDSLRDGSRTGSDVAYGFVFSQEFLNRGTTNAQYLDVLYHAFFDRDGDAGGFNDWLSQLNAGVSRADVLNGFIYAQEFVNLCNEYGITPFVQQPQCENVAGTWSTVEINDERNCGGGSAEYEYMTYSVTQNDCSISVTNLTYGVGPFTGTVDGSHVSWSGQYPEEGGTTTANISLDFSGNSLTGSATWTWSGFGEVCSGTSQISGTRN